MKLIIVGLGGVGGIVGGRLAAGLSQTKEHEVVFWCRGKTLESVRESGIQLLGGDGCLTVRPALATCDAREAGKADCILFATKGYHLEDAARDAVPLTTEKTVVIPLLNGVSAVSTLEKHLPGDVLGGCIYISAHVERPGVVRQVGSVQKILFGKKGLSLEENRRRYGSLEGILKKSGIDVVLTERIDTEMWSKFIFLSPFAGVTTLFGRTVDGVLTDPESFETVGRMIREIENVARAKGTDLPPDIADLTLEKARAFAAGTKTSMQVDQEQGRPTELETLIGTICEEGRALGVPVPTYETVYRSLKNTA
ncbi:MAG: 2-dehydropantoate 2-reductase [Synergistaceae bacterium]|nr:2-dehydropantoate 2-reductase [Synergistaceae bacterium]